MDYHLEDFLGLGNIKPIRKALKTSLINKDSEACGFFYYKNNFLDYDFMHIENKDKYDPNHFVMRSKEFSQKYIDKHVISLFHSHNDLTDEALSETDAEIAKSLNLPSFVFSVKNKKQNLFYPDNYKPRPLDRRVFIPFFQDCLIFVKDYYDLILNIKLTKKVSNWARRGSNTNEDLIESIEHMFQEVPDKTVKKNDILIHKPNLYPFFHLSIFIGSNQIYHHPVSAYPVKELFKPEDMNKVYKVYRYKEV